MESTPSKKEVFIEKIKHIYGERASEILDAIKLPRYETFRLNPTLGGAEEVLGTLGKMGFEVENGPLPNSYVNLSSRGNLKVSQTDYFKTGKIYVQGLSSMLDTLVLDPLPSEKILDLCASPGSKTSHIATIAGEPGNITAVENNSSRFYAMKKNLSLQGYADVKTVKSDAVSLPRKNPQLQEHFDKVLVDVPCSNEGNIRISDEASLQKWNPKLASKIQMLQKRILASGINMLKKGGFLVYSTCTYSFEENESVIGWALKKFPEMELVEVIFPESIGNFTHGFTSYNGKTVDDKIKLTVRILPNSTFDGFFIARFRKLPY